MSPDCSESDEESLKFEDFYRYFARWESAYPNGIPEEYIESDTEGVSSVDSESSVVKAHFVVAVEEFGAEEQALYHAALQKGLQWESRDVVVHLLDEDGARLAEVRDAIHRADKATPVFFLGARCSQFGEEILSPSKIFSAVSFREALTSREAKMELWKMLQKLLS